MARDGSGNYSIPNTFTPNTTIASTAVNANFSDIATALTGSLARDSQGPMTAALVLHQNGFNYEVDPDTGIKRTGANEQAIFCGGSNVVVVGTATISIAIAVNVIGAFAALGTAAFSNTITATNSTPDFIGMELIGTDAGAATGPNLNLYRNSASPAASDFIGRIIWHGMDSGANKTAYGTEGFQITDPTNGSEDADWILTACIGGALTTIMKSSGAQIQIPGSLAVTGAVTVPAGNWALVDLAQTAKSFQAALYHIVALSTSGVDGGNLSSGSWNTRELNTEITDELTVTTTSNQISLAAGTYYVEAQAVTYFQGSSTPGGNNHVESQLRVRNVTDGTTLRLGLVSTYRSNDDGGGNNCSVEVTLETSVSGRFILPGTKLVELQNWVATTLSAAVLAVATKAGNAAGATGESEVYADLKIWKVG